ncbi:Outer membrane protein TolC [Desulfocicer vacuolatum DSM 3385]|uniref:Outer membrane protein TolC n=1 Tax=Desulfocicer vacuolatum DSM 3385 TaxID=1121400 RepID=A0A1W2BUC7_9BACT|nr:TolC family protein [Desulfocicer vacuolatum]SMC76491.1 Outer membrane protein TolC [Desulfocicer vacuolatum DSM 3385]
MKNKFIAGYCLFILFITVATPFQGRAEIFSLKQSIEYGIKHSPLIQGEKIRIDQAEMDIKSLRGHFLPTISTSYSHSKIINEYSSGNTDEDYIDQKNSVAGLKINQTLFAGFENKNRFDKAKLQKAYQKAMVNLQKIDLVNQIRTFYFELLKTRYDVSSITQSIKRLETDLASAKAFSAKKMAAYVYVLQAEADLEEAKQQLLNTNILIYKHTQRLKRLLGLSQDVNFTNHITFDDEFETPRHDDVGLDITQCIEEAMTNRPEIKLLLLKIEMASKDAAISKGRYYPRINLDLGLYDSDKQYDKTSSSYQDQHNTYWSAGISVQMNLFDGGSAFYENKRHHLEIQRIKTDSHQIEMEIKEEVGVAFHALEESLKRLVSVENALLASQEGYERQKKRFNARIGTTSQVLDAQATLARSEARKGQALLDYQMSLAELYDAMGLTTMPMPSARGWSN